jgi:thiol:disulfide interchange protein
VKQAFMQNNVNVIVADWTAGDAKITNFLTKEGAAGVPLYLWFDSEGKKEVLPQVLTPDLLISKANHSDG